MIWFTSERFQETRLPGTFASFASETLRRDRDESMGDMPFWFKVVVWLVVGLTVLYAAWGMIHSILQS